MTNDYVARDRGRALTWWALALGAALLASGCCDDGEEPCEPGATDSLVPLADAGSTYPNCKTDEVECKAGETNAFGICLGEGAMVKVDGAELTMGHDEPGMAHDPAHQVTLTGFYIDKTEVTVAAYKACVDCGACAKPARMGSHTGREPYYGNETYADYPAIYVTWQDAKAYCEAIGKRLPTEAEWELAARGTGGKVYPWGDTSPAATTANFGGLVNDTDKVGSYAKGASPAGALDMAGNVYEWVADYYDAGYYASSPASDPTGPDKGVTRVVRGGCFLSPPELVRTYARSNYAETAAFSFIGFRCAKDL